jgi:hypothetical protein
MLLLNVHMIFLTPYCSHTSFPQLVHTKSSMPKCAQKLSPSLSLIIRIQDLLEIQGMDYGHSLYVVATMWGPFL